MSSAPSSFLSLEKSKIRLSFADLREKKPKEGGDKKGATHTGMSSGREQGTDNRAQEWGKERIKEVSHSGWGGGR